MNKLALSMSMVAFCAGLAIGNADAAEPKAKGKGKKNKPAATAPAAPAEPTPGDQQLPTTTAPEESKPTTDKPSETAPSGDAAGGDQAIQMRGLEERVNDLKEKIFRSKARLMLLRETVLSGAIAGAKAVLTHRNEMGGAFVLESVSYFLDGAPIFTKVDKDGDLSEKEEVEIFNGSIVPGNHNLSVNMVYRGSGFGIFSYFRGYKFRIKSSYQFTADEGKITAVKVVAYEKGGFTTDLADRPAVRYDVDIKQDANAPQPPAADGSAAAPASSP